jgi:hypothetical protein
MKDPRQAFKGEFAERAFPLQIPEETRRKAKK